MTIKKILACLAAYVFILFRHGYVFGSGDQSEMLPYAKHLADNTLYPKDFYIQGIAPFVPNERFVFSKLLSFFVNHLAELSFGLHALATVALLLGLRFLAEKWVVTEGMRWIAVLAPFFILYNINLGGNELYYNTLTPSYLAQVIGLWAFVVIFNGYMDGSYAFILLATLIHPLIGVQLWFLVAVTHFISKYHDRAYESWRTIILLNVGYLLMAGFYIFKIKSGYDNGQIPSDVFLNILEFRAPHHYYPDYFPLKNWVILIPLFALYFAVAKPLLRVIIGVLLTGCVVYAFGVLVLKSPTIASVQWFSTTVWLKTFALMAFVGLTEPFIEDKKWFQKVFNNTLIVNCLIGISLISIIFMTPQYRLFKNKNYDFFVAELKQSNDVDIALKAKDLTPKDALFLIPSDLSTFRYWSERNIFVDYKTVNHRQTAFAEWYDRIQKVYNISLDDRRRNADLPFLANENFKRLTENDLMQFAKNQGITHILTFKTVALNFPKIGENDGFVIYEIR